MHIYKCILFSFYIHLIRSFLEEETFKNHIFLCIYTVLVEAHMVQNSNQYVYKISRTFLEKDGVMYSLLMFLIYHLKLFEFMYSIHNSIYAVLSACRKCNNYQEKIIGKILT